MTIRHLQFNLYARIFCGELRDYHPHHYSPDSASCDFNLFPHMKMKLKSRRFETFEVIQKEFQATFQVITESEYKKLFTSGKSCGSSALQVRGTTLRVMAVL